MNFLAPLFLLGGLAVALPVIFHLVRRASQNKIPFSSLMFLQPAIPRMASRRRLEHLILLLLRCLVLLLLALAFARPFLMQLSTADTSNQIGRKIIVLVDTSASMKRDGLWDQARDQASQVLKSLTPADQVALMTFDREPRFVLGFNQWNNLPGEQRAPFALQRLAELKPGWAAAHLARALVTAAESFTEGDKQNPNTGPRQIILISDIKEGARLDGLQGYDWPRGLEVRTVQLQPRRPTNAGLQWVVDTGDAAPSEEPAAAGPRLRVSNSSNAKREQFQLHWEGVAAAPAVDLYIPPGQSRVVPAPKLPPGVSGERLVITGDDDDFDNKVWITQPKPEQVQILYAGNDATNDSARPLYYLKRAFQVTRRQAVEVKARPLSMTFSPEELSAARLLVVTDLLPATPLAQAETFLTNGGTVLYVLDNPAAASTAGRLAGVDNLTATPVTPASYAMFGQIDFEHPLFAAFSDPRYNDFTKIHFWKYQRLDAAKIPGARLLARFDDGAPALIEVQRGRGRLLILTSGWVPSDSQLALSSKFVPLLYAMLDLAGGVKAPLAQFHIGDSVDLSSALASAPDQPLTVRPPNGHEIVLPAGVTLFTATDEPGLYTIPSARPPLRFAVNLDPSESRTAPLPVEELARLGVPIKPPAPDPARQIEQKRRLLITEVEGRQKLWRWLTFAALLLLLMETGLAGWLTRRATRPTEEAV
jgi:hypothetical protein